MAARWDSVACHQSVTASLGGRQPLSRSCTQQRQQLHRPPAAACRATRRATATSTATSTSNFGRSGHSSKLNLISTTPFSLALLVALQPGNSSGGSAPPPVSPAVFLWASTAGHAAMVALGIAVGDTQGLGVSAQLLSSANLSLPAAVGFALPLGALCWLSTRAAESVPEFAALRELLKKELIPQLAAQPPYGLCLLAMGAGVAEETLFRAFLQPAAIQGIAGVVPALPDAAATAAGLTGTAVVFGALHAITPLYFWFATGAGLLFGYEYLQCGLQTAATTHWLYDWAAMVFLVNEWRDGVNGSNGSNVPPLGAAAPDAEGE